MKRLCMSGIHSICLALIFISFQSAAGMFSITVNNLGGLTSTQADIFEDAVDFWEFVLPGVQSSIDLNLHVSAKGVNIDGEGNVLGSAGPSAIAFGLDAGFVYASRGIMEFDTADLSALERANLLFDVIVHEMAHVIGFGTLWDTGRVFAGTQNVYTRGTGRYTGAYALDIYRQEFDPDATFIPVELDGGAGTADGHWDEFWPGGASDLMTGYLGPVPTTVSRTTIASFADIGYLTIATHAVNAPTTFSIFVIALCCACLRRERKYQFAFRQTPVLSTAGEC